MVISSPSASCKRTLNADVAVAVTPVVVEIAFIAVTAPETSVELIEKLAVAVSFTFIVYVVELPSLEASKAYVSAVAVTPAL